MPTVATFMKKRELPKRLADRLPVAPEVEVEVIVRTLPEPAKTEAERKEAGKRALEAMDVLSAEAQKNGLTEEKLKQILVEIEEEEDEERRKKGFPTRDPKFPIDINNW